MTQRRFEQVSAYIDESGNISSKRQRELRLVGGVLVFGPCSDSDERSLLQSLRASVEEAGGLFPDDLKYHKGKRQRSAALESGFLADMGKRLKIWCGATRAVYGFYVVHDEDRFSVAGDLLDEARWDNRYKELLASTLEYLMFVSPRVEKRLTPDASWRVTVASRVFPLESGTERAEVENLGYRVVEDRKKPGQYLALGTIDSKGLGLLVQQITRSRWVGRKLNLASVEVPVLDYEEGYSPAPLYLADLYCGSVRRLLWQREVDRVTGVLLTTELAPTLEAWSYSAVDKACRLVRTLEAKDLRAVTPLVGGLRTTRTSCLPDDLRKKCEGAYRALIEGDKLAARRVLEEAVSLADEPGGLGEAGDMASALSLGALDEPVDQARLLLVRLSQANHVGDTGEATRLWREYKGIEPLLLRAGETGLTLRCEIRNRRAVSLTDQFQYEEAVGLLRPLIETGSAARDQLRQLHGIPDSAPFPDRALGACFGTMGQLSAFLGTPDTQSEAEKTFKLAMGLFDDPYDIERQWVYLGHLACDLDDAEEAHSLWQEVSGAIPCLTGKTLPPDAMSPFVLALRLKGLLRFWNGGDALDPANPLTLAGLEDDDVPNYHPYGLILQAIGMLAEQRGRSESSTMHLRLAHGLYERASSHMRQGGALLRVLACVAEVRAGLVLDGADDREPVLRTAFLKLRGLVTSEFGDSVWGEDDSGRPTGKWGECDPGPGGAWADRCRGALRFVRFNYW